MRVRPSSAHEDCLHLRPRPQVVCKGGFHAGAGEVGESEVVGGGGGGDEGGDLREGMRGHDVDGFEEGRKGGVGGEGGEVDYEEDEAVFAAVVGEGE